MPKPNQNIQSNSQKREKVRRNLIGSTVIIGILIFGMWIVYFSSESSSRRNVLELLEATFTMIILIWFFWKWYLDHDKEDSTAFRTVKTYVGVNVFISTIIFAICSPILLVFGIISLFSPRQEIWFSGVGLIIMGILMALIAWRSWAQSKLHMQGRLY